MLSLLKPGFVYTDISEDITENDIDVVSDEWNMEGRIVYRGSRDPRYTHANVYWLYNEDLQRVGCTEHDMENHADFRLLWFRDNDFGTLLQEDNWIPTQDIWSILPTTPFERFVNEGWTTPKSFLEQCLAGPVRIMTTDMILTRPNIHYCGTCGKKSLNPIPMCVTSEVPLDFPDKNSIYFVDSDMIIYAPPKGSKIWSILQVQRDDDYLLREPVEEQVPQEFPVEEL